jgi:hypothetical protein
MCPVPTTRSPSAGASPIRRCRQPDDVPDAFNQRTAAGAEGHRGRSLPQAFEGGQGPGIGQPIAAGRHRQVIAAELAFRPDIMGDPPDGGVIEQQRFDQHLQQVHPVIVASDMGEFVGEDQFQLLRREPAQAAGRNQDHRPEPTDHHRHLDERGFEQQHRPTHAEATLEFRQSFAPCGVHRANLSGSDRSNRPVALQQAQGQ